MKVRGRMKVRGQTPRPSDTPLGRGESPPRWAKSTAGAGKAFPLWKRGMKGDLKSPLTPLYERGE